MVACLWITPCPPLAEVLEGTSGAGRMIHGLHRQDWYKSMINNPAYWELTIPVQLLRWRANVLFRHSSHVPSAERATLGAARDGLGEQRLPALHLLPSAPRGGAEGDYREDEGR